MLPDHQTRHLAALEYLDTLRREAALQRLISPPELSEPAGKRWQMTLTLTVELKGAG